MQRSMTNIELAHIDIDFLQNNHRKLWKKFLKSNENRDNKNFSFEKLQSPSLIEQNSKT